MCMASEVFQKGEEMRDVEFRTRMDRNTFLFMCTLVANNHCSMTYYNPKLGLRLSDFKNWEPFVDDDYGGELMITVRYRTRTDWHRMLEYAQHFEWDLYRLDHFYGVEASRRLFLAFFGFDTL